MSEIPSEEDWGEYWNDFDRKSAYESFFGKSNEQMQRHFYENGNELINEIRFMPLKVFKYYVLGFRDFISAGKFPVYEASDFTSYFLNMVEYLLDNDVLLIRTSMAELMPTLEYIANNQKKYEAPHNIYGDYLDKLDNIKMLCKKYSVSLGN